MKRKTRSSLFQELRNGLEEGIAHLKGQFNLRTTVIPEQPPEIKPAALIRLREQAAMSQAIFARVLKVSTKTVQSREQGLRKPSQASRRLIQVFSERPEVVCQIAGFPLKRANSVTAGSNRNKARTSSLGAAPATTASR